MIYEYLLPQTEELQPAVLFQLDGAPALLSKNVMRLLVIHFPEGWFGRGGPITTSPS